MSHAWVGIPDLIQEEFEDNLVEEARKLAAFEARDLAIATAVRDAILERNRLGWEKLPALNLVEIIKGVK